MSKRTKSGYECGCHDEQCPEHEGIARCAERPTVILYRVDMTDPAGTTFCDGCAADADASGLFSYETPEHDPEACDLCNASPGMPCASNCPGVLSSVENGGRL